MAPRFPNVLNNRSCRKRPADKDELDGEPPIKKFALLNIVDENNCGSESKSRRDDFPRSDGMHLDDTKHTTYIYDIDRELEEVESQEEHLTFLPDIEKKLTAIPRAILERPTPQNNELVLYRPADYFVLQVEKTQAKEPSSGIVSTPKSCPVSVNGVLKQPIPDKIDHCGLSYPEGDMDIDI